MFLIALSCALVAFGSSVDAGYASSSSGAGLYNSNSYQGQNYGSKYPYSNQYTGYAGGSVNSGFPVAPFANPFEFQNAFQQYFSQLSALNANLYNQQLAHQQALFNSIRNQAYGGGGYNGGAAYGGASAGSFGGAGYGSTGSYGGVGPVGTYGGTFGGPNYASAGGAVGNGYQQQHAAIYPENPAHPNLDSRFGGDEGTTYTQGRPGFVGVSSFSSSSDINGVKHRESATSVNNNGKVTTYHTRN